MLLSRSTRSLLVLAVAQVLFILQVRLELAIPERVSRNTLSYGEATAYSVSGSDAMSKVYFALSSGTYTFGIPFAAAASMSN